MDWYFYSRVLLKRLPFLLGLMFLGLLIGLGVAQRMPDVYEGRATLIVESEQIPDDLAASTVRTSEQEALQIISQRILTRDSLLEMANRTGIYPNIGQDGAPILTADEKVAELRERIIINTGSGDKATIVRVGFGAPTGRLAADVTNDIVTRILQENVKMRTSVSGQTLDFFNQEVERLESALKELTALKLDFQENNIEALPDSLQFRRSRQAALQERLNQLNREEAALKERQLRIDQIISEGGDPERRLATQVFEQQPLSHEEERLRNLQIEYDNLGVTLSASNPRMKNLKRKIDAVAIVVEAQKVEQAQTTQILDDREVPTQLELQLADIDAQLRYTKDRKDLIATEMAELDATIRATPGNAITLASLQRDFDNVQKQYNHAVRARAQAETGDIIESLSKGRRITVIEHATIPPRPATPSRKLVVAAGVGGGLAVGLAVVLLLELLSKSVRRPQEISSELGIEVFASIPYIPTPGELARRRFAAIGTAVTMAIGLPLAIWFLNANVMPLETTIDLLVSGAELAALR